MSKLLYPQILRAVSEAPWAIRPEKLAVIQQLLAMRASGVRFTSDEIEARIGSGPAHRAPAQQGGSVAVIPIYGVIQPKADAFTQMSGGTTAQGLIDAVNAAADDSSIGGILIDVDSPGGIVGLIPELASAIRSARDAKPVVAVANTQAASAAYWLASQADELVVTPSGEVGSIGVFAVHEDISGMLEQDGVAVSLIKAGKFKAETNPWEPLSDEARAHVQEDVDAYYEMFVADVAAGRGVTADAVRGGFGEGRMLLANDAVRAGMADRVDTFDTVLGGMLEDAASAAGANARAALAAGLPAGYVAQFDSTPLLPAAVGAHTHPNVIQPGAARPGFVEAARAVRDEADRLTTEARSLRESTRGLSGPKRDALADLADPLADLSAAIAELAVDPALAEQAEREHLRFIKRRVSIT